MQTPILASGRWPGAETQVARRKVKFLVIERIVRDVHLAVDAQQLAVGVDDGGGVVINAGGALFKERGDDDGAVAARQFAQASVLGPGMVSASLK